LHVPLPSPFRVLALVFIDVKKYEFLVRLPGQDRTNCANSLHSVVNDNRPPPLPVPRVLPNSFAYELSKPYIMYRNDSNVIHGIWFFEEHECDVVSNILTR